MSKDPTSTPTPSLRAMPGGTATGRWLLAAFIPAGVIAMAVVAAGGGDRGAVVLGLRATARWSYLWFWAAYAGGALAAVLGTRFQVLARHGREFGLAFAAAQSVHAALVLWLYVGPFQRPGTRTLEIFGPALGLTYLLAALSFRRLAAPFPPAAVRGIRFIGVEYIALAFLIDFAKNPFGGGRLQLLAYLPFQALALAGPTLRILAYVRRRRTIPEDTAGGRRRMPAQS